MPDQLDGPSVAVAERTAERRVDELPELPLHLLREDGGVAVQLRTTLRRVAVGASLARRGDLLDRLRALPEVPAHAVSPVGGTFIVGGEAWLGLAAIGRPPEGALPIDWMQAALAGWFAHRLAPLGVTIVRGRVDGAWCPGFSDLSVGGRKLVGLGYRATRDWVAMRGVMPVRRIPDDDLAVLAAVHRLIDVEVRRPACTSLAEATGDDTWTVERAMDLLS